jgi:hypothetical protein
VGSLPFSTSNSPSHAHTVLTAHSHLPTAPQHPPNPHHISSAAMTSPIDQSVPSVLDSAVEILVSLDASEVVSSGRRRGGISVEAHAGRMGLDMETLRRAGVLVWDLPPNRQLQGAGGFVVGHSYGAYCCSCYWRRGCCCDKTYFR